MGDGEVGVDWSARGGMRRFSAAFQAEMAG